MSFLTPLTANDFIEGHSMHNLLSKEKESKEKESKDSEFKETKSKEINIHVIGVGGCGGNAITNMAGLCQHSNIRFTSINTDISALHQCNNHEVLLIGEATTKGYGAGADPQVAYNAALQSEEALSTLIENDTIIIIIAGLGGGTGSGVTPVLLDMAKKNNIDVMCFVTLPFKSEGSKRKEIALTALQEIKAAANATLVLSNDSLMAALNETVGLLSAFRHCDTQMHRIVEAIITMLTKTGYINVDINDFSHILSLEGNTALGVGVAEDGSLLCDALTHALENPLVDDQSIIGAQGVIVQLTCKEEPSLAMYEQMLATLQNLIESSRALIITGVTVSAELPHFSEVLVIATGIPVAPQHSEIKEGGEFEKSTESAEYTELEHYKQLEQFSLLEEVDMIEQSRELEEYREFIEEMLPMKMNGSRINANLESKYFNIPAFIRQQMKQ
ncbi:cell division protein FtsZ [Alteromonas sp. BMJM2]|uniref:cell division protein FtsZ n=1 Tax=Alteromonas sp. BMJM2 TaxID=2954241 RepID=UPI0022B3CE4E|nr:cell division protein FtsZ [Alteromonas sp. BMJM2]